jgi:hypothetical protein
MSMSATIQTESTGCWTGEFWVHHCEGFSVEGPDGEIGIVEAVVCGADGDVEALTVRRRDRGDRHVVPAVYIRSVDPTLELVLLRAAPALHVPVESAPQ